MAALLEFLKQHDAETIYLVGDIVDGWRLRSGWYWPQSHNDVVQKLLRKARKGARIVYVPGNHDEFLREYCGMNFGGIEIRETDIHVAADGKRYLVMHGDVFDVVVRHARWLAYLGFTVELCFVYVVMMGTMLGTAGLFLLSGLALGLVALIITRIEKRLRAVQQPAGAQA